MSRKLNSHTYIHEKHRNSILMRIVFFYSVYIYVCEKQKKNNKEEMQLLMETTFRRKQSNFVFANTQSD